MKTITREEIIQDIYDNPNSWRFILASELRSESKNIIIKVNRGKSELHIVDTDGNFLDLNRRQKKKLWKVFQWWKENKPIAIKCEESQ